jgi:hypothetical protein
MDEDRANNLHTDVGFREERKLELGECLVWGIDVKLAQRCMPHLWTVWVSTVRKTTLSTSRPMMITVVRPANT